MHVVLIDASRPSRPTAKGRCPLGAASSGPALRRQLDALGDRRVTVVLGRHADAVLEHVPERVDVRLNRHWDDLGEAAALALGLRKTPPDQPAIILPFGMPCPVLPPSHDSVLVVDPRPRPNEPGVLVIDARIARVDFGFGFDNCWTGVMFLAAAAKRAFIAAAAVPVRRRWLAMEVLNVLLDDDHHFVAKPLPAPGPAVA